jgi:hypothetical protein
MAAVDDRFTGGSDLLRAEKNLWVIILMLCFSKQNKEKECVCSDIAKDSEILL